MGKIIDSYKRGRITIEVPKSWTEKKTQRVVLGLLIFSVLFGFIYAEKFNPFLLSLCIFSAFIAGQFYYIVANWSKVQKAEELVGKCIYLNEIDEGHYCSRGFITVYDKIDKYEPRCKNCPRKTVVR